MLPFRWWLFGEKPPLLYDPFVDGFLRLDRNGDRVGTEIDESTVDTFDKTVDIETIDPFEIVSLTTYGLPLDRVIAIFPFFWNFLTEGIFLFLVGSPFVFRENITSYMVKVNRSRLTPTKQT